MTYHIVSTPKSTTAKEIYTASGGRGYVENKELHLTSPTVHYIYKHTGDPAGWYMRNDITGADYYLGAGACPTVNLDNVSINDAAYWSEITFTPETDAETVEG